MSQKTLPDSLFPAHPSLKGPVSSGKDCSEWIQRDKGKWREKNLQLAIQSPESKTAGPNNSIVMATGPRGLTQSINCQRSWVPGPRRRKAKWPILKGRASIWWGFSRTRKESQMFRNNFKLDPQTSHAKVRQSWKFGSFQSIESNLNWKKKDHFCSFITL